MKTIKCPHCNKEMIVGSKINWTKPSSVAISFKPGKTERLELVSVCEALKAFSKVLREIGKDAGVKVVPVIDKMETRDDGELFVSVFVLRTK